MSLRLFETVASLLTTSGCRLVIKTCQHRGPLINIPHQQLVGSATWHIPDEYQRAQVPSHSVDPTNWAQDMANTAYDARQYWAMNRVVLLREQMQEIAETGKTRGEFDLEPKDLPLPEVCAKVLYSLTYHGYAVEVYSRKLTLLLPPPVEYVDK